MSSKVVQLVSLIAAMSLSGCFLFNKKKEKKEGDDQVVPVSENSFSLSLAKIGSDRYGGLMFPKVQVIASLVTEEGKSHLKLSIGGKMASLPLITEIKKDQPIPAKLEFNTSSAVFIESQSTLNLRNLTHIDLKEEIIKFNGILDTASLTYCAGKADRWVMVKTDGPKLSVAVMTQDVFYRKSTSQLDVNGTLSFTDEPSLTLKQSDSGFKVIWAANDENMMTTTCPFAIPAVAGKVLATPNKDSFCSKGMRTGRRTIKVKANELTGTLTEKFLFDESPVALDIGFGIKDKENGKPVLIYKGEEFSVDYCSKAITSQVLTYDNKKLYFRFFSDDKLVVGSLSDGFYSENTPMIIRTNKEIILPTEDLKLMRDDTRKWTATELSGAQSHNLTFAGSAEYKINDAAREVREAHGIIKLDTKEFIFNKETPFKAYSVRILKDVTIMFDGNNVNGIKVGATSFKIQERKETFLKSTFKQES